MNIQNKFTSYKLYFILYVVYMQNESKWIVKPKISLHVKVDRKRNNIFFV